MIRFVLLLSTMLMSCAAPKDQGRNQSDASPEAGPETTTQDNQQKSGTGSIVGNALTGDEVIVGIDLEAPYIGVEEGRIFGYDGEKKRGDRVRGRLKTADGLVSADLPERAQVIKDLTDDLFLLIRDGGGAYTADAYLIRKSDGNVWQIATGQRFLVDTLSWVEDAQAATIYFAAESYAGGRFVTSVYGIKARAGAGDVQRVKLADADVYRVIALAGDEVIYEGITVDPVWVAGTFSKTPTIYDMSQLGLSLEKYQFVAGRAYRFESADTDDRIIAVSNGPSGGVPVSGLTATWFGNLAWAVHRNGVDVIATDSQIFMVDPKAKALVREYSLPMFTGRVSILDARDVTVVTEVSGSGLCVVSSAELPATVVCTTKANLGVRGKPYKVSSTSNTSFTLFSRIDGTAMHQELTLKLDGEKLEVLEEAAKPYSPVIDTLVPLYNIYRGI